MDQFRPLVKNGRVLVGAETVVGCDGVPVTVPRFEPLDRLRWSDAEPTPQAERRALDGRRIEP